MEFGLSRLSTEIKNSKELIMKINNAKTTKVEKYGVGCSGCTVIGEKENSDTIVAHCTIYPNQKINKHIHKSCDVIYYILKGSGVVNVENESKRVEVGDSIFIPKNTVHNIENDTTEELEQLFIGPVNYDVVFV